MAGEPHRNESDWSEREDSLLNELSESIVYYRGRAKVAKILGYSSRVSLLILSILTPIFISSSANEAAGAAVLGISRATISQAALLISILVAAAEGLRLIFRFEDRWANCWICVEGLKTARENYLDQSLQFEVGSKEWIGAYSSLRTSYRAIVENETKEFFEATKVSVLQNAAEYGKNKPS